MIDSEAVLWNEIVHRDALLLSRQARAYSANLRRSAAATRSGVAELIERARAILTASQTQVDIATGAKFDGGTAAVRPTQPCATVPATSMPQPGVVLQALAALGLGENDLGDLTDDLIAAYREADQRDDAEMRATLRRALMCLGRHLARDVGPKVAGVVMN